MASNFDVKPHADTWQAFCAMALRGTIGIIVLLVLMALFLL